MPLPRRAQACWVPESQARVWVQVLVPVPVLVQVLVQVLVLILVLARPEQQPELTTTRPPARANE
jgi:hypothetical protein